MRVRMPLIDFTNVPARWMPRNPELAQLMNAQSVGVPYLERFLNKVMQRARQQMQGNDPVTSQLRADIQVFVKQESCHTAIHSAFNKAMIADGYPELPHFEAIIAAHYDHLLKSKSLKFLVAYCEGFETFGPPIAKDWLDGMMDRYFADADPQAAMLYRWHVMEEFEHRTVAYDTFKAIGGGYFLRIYGYFFQMYHYNRLGKMVNKYMLAVDRSKMTPEQVEQSKRNAKEASKVLMGPVLKGMLKTLMPWYSPRELEIPDRYGQLVSEIEDKWLVPAATRISLASS